MDRVNVEECRTMVGMALGRESTEIAHYVVVAELCNDDAIHLITCHDKIKTAGMLINALRALGPEGWELTDLDDLPQT